MGIDWATFGPLLGQAAGETAYMVLITLVAGGLFGLLIGLGLYLTRAGNLLANRVVFAVLNVIINLVRPIPFIIFLALLMPVTRFVTGRTIGIEAFTFAMCVMATMVFSRLIEQNLVSLDPGVIEAARAMGATPLRIVRTVLVPEALAPLILGYTFLFVVVLDMSAIGGYLGAGGLGDLAIVHGYQQYNWSIIFVVVVIIVAVVQLVQVLGNTLARRALRR
ncbi:methionine ABC transporter permease [Xylanimonas protaetiae]|uniref:ABC transporter permease subunit n=1 Tax=Xylanimonas protaetiae TaxID=2509457 RepID=A0A4V0YG30_9MICO|nr:ABC transporter permease subunit [Xylanimonas protaetiae]QAY69781.1 ABC transporter permease subunit [Xylanimonas protaetiae]